MTPRNFDASTTRLSTPSMDGGPALNNKYRIVSQRKQPLFEKKMHEEARAVAILEFLQRGDGELVQFGVGARLPRHRRDDASGGRDFGEAIEAQLGVK
mmetsp:Transcript_17752/g.39347  ORF Transcript_17752/g.39347 Transcript_17752/m.39347 type:complete len:98 (+) Transcript_17752:528-821(+)